MSWGKISRRVQDEIDRLRTENAALKEALSGIVDDIAMARAHKDCVLRAGDVNDRKARMVLEGMK